MSEVKVGDKTEDCAGTVRQSRRMRIPSTSTAMLGVLSEKKNWGSEELQRVLDQQIERREMILHKKGELEREAERLSVDRKRNIKLELEELHKIFVKLKGQVNKMMKEKLPGRIDRPDFYQNVERADELENASAYLTILNFFKATSEQIEANLETELETEAIDLFHRLKRIEVAYLDITDCSHLQQYGKGVVCFWEARLKDKLVKDFEKLLESFGWPMGLKTATPTLETHEKFHRAILNLAKISSDVISRDDTSKINQSAESHAVEGFPEPILPIKIMMGPLKRRFRFHFFSDKPTSESSRPDWYFSQVKTWLRDLIPFVRTHLEPVSVSEIQVSSVIEFVRAVSEMLIVKIDADLDSDAEDDVFVRILEESIAYENEMGDFVGDDMLTTETFMPPFVNTVFSRSVVLERWLSVERKACWEKLDEMFASASAWDRPVVPGPPEIVDLFLAVIRCVTDRFSHLQQPGQRMQFLQLLIELLDDFRIRCLQMWKSRTEFNDFSSKDILIDYVIADALHYVHDMLVQWEDLPFFSSLSFFIESIEREEEKARKELSSVYNLRSSEIVSGFTEGISLEDQNTKSIGSPSKGLFSNACHLYLCLGDEILFRWCQKVMRKIRHDIVPYSKKKWHVHEAVKGTETLSEELVLPLQAIKDVAKAVECTMNPNLADKWLKRLAVRLDEMWMEMVILPNRFSRAAVSQLYYDLTNGMFPIFKDSGINETLFFGGLCSSVTILGISTGEAMLLYDTLMNGNYDAHELALAELSISICQSEAIKILRGRCDLHL